ncbi:MAG: hypothetical protein IAG13_16925, partial [Deltaproteobacteria bacterium]|nr:hypothetical protein [Nannocystaceae bacterium]
EVPLPGTAFPLEGTPAGELVVGTFDLDARKPLSGIEVTLEIAKADGTKEKRTAITDERGKVDFHELGAPKTPAGTKLTVSAVVVAGAPAQRSASFEMDAKIGMAVVLAKGTLSAQAEQPQRPTQRPRVPGPRVVASLASGHVRARIVDAGDKPVSGQRVIVVKKDATNSDVEYPGTTGADGTAEIEVAIQSDAIYLVETIYDGGPYRSGFFQVDRQGGIAVDLRVYETTSDVRRVRAVAQFDVDGLENDHARVVQLQDVMVMGDEAYWPAGGMRIFPAAGAKNLKVLPMSEEFLAHDDEKAPWVTLAGPLPPGELVRLGLAYLVEHDGDAELVWSTPLDSLETSVLVGPGLQLEAEGAKPSDHESPIPEKVIYVMGPRAPGAELDMTISGLPTRNPVYRIIAAIIATLLVGLTMAMVVLRPRADARTRLLARRDELLAVLEHAAADPSRRTRVITALDRVYRQLDALPGGAHGTTSGVPNTWVTVLLLVVTELHLVVATTAGLAFEWPLVGIGGALLVYFSGVMFFVVAMMSRRSAQVALLTAAGLYALRFAVVMRMAPEPWEQWPLMAATVVLLVAAAVRAWPVGAAAGSRPKA